MATFKTKVKKSAGYKWAFTLPVTKVVVLQNRCSRPSSLEIVLVQAVYSGTQSLLQTRHGNQFEDRRIPGTAVSSSSDGEFHVDQHKL